MRPHDQQDFGLWQSVAATRQSRLNKNGLLVVWSLILLAITAWSCSSPLERGDTARARGDWDSAVSSYEEALRSTSEPGEIGMIKQRLSEARSNAAAAHVAEADHAETLQDHRGFVDHLRRAYALEPSNAVKVRLEKAQQEEGARCLSEGRIRLEQGRLRESIECLTRAVEMGAGVEASELLGKARNADERAREAEYQVRVDEARRHLAAREWAAAFSEYDLAHAAEKHDDSMRESAFAAHMSKGEAAVFRGDSYSISEANREFKSAAKFQIDSEYVTGRVAATEAVDLVIKVLGAVILPVKPVSGKPWDGFGGARDVGALTRGIGDLLDATPQAMIAGQLLAPLLAAGADPPDCFVTVTVGDKSFGGIGSTCMNSYTPRWDVGVVLSNTTASDDRTITITVTDKDLEQHDPGGTAHMPVAELVRRAKAGPLRFVDKDGSLQGEGIVQLDVSVERRPPGSDH